MDSHSKQIIKRSPLILTRLILNMLNKQEYGKKQKLLFREQFKAVLMPYSYVTGRQQVERPSQCKVQKRNLASSSEQSIILRNRSSRSKAN